MARGYSSELWIAYLYKTNKSNLALPAPNKRVLRKSDTLINAATWLIVGASRRCYAAHEQIGRVAIYDSVQAEHQGRLYIYAILSIIQSFARKRANFAQAF